MNKLIIAVAGSGKTTYLIEQALRIEKNKNVLITTYTEANELEIRKKIIEKKGYMPSNITTQTWFSFLLQHGVRPYQGCVNEELYNQDIKGMLQNNGEYGIKYITKQGFKVGYKEDTEFFKHYFSSDMKIYSDKLSKFVIRSNEKSNGLVIKRLEEIYQYIFIDEIQDLAGYDLEILKLLLQSNIKVLFVGDPRQTTYLTHYERQYNNYKKGKIKDFISKLPKKIQIEIDETTLSNSHRNNQLICDFASLLYPEFNNTNSCNCCGNSNINHQGIFIINKKQVEAYINKYAPVELRWDKRIKVASKNVYNFGEAKGLTFDRVLIYTTKKIKEWLKNQNISLEFTTKAKLYVAITRAKYSVTFVVENPEDYETDFLKVYKD